MSLVPYSSRDSREIVLRHNDAVVVRDPQSKQLTLRGSPAPQQPVDECPLCHRAFQAAHHSSPSGPAGELQATHGRDDALTSYTNQDGFVSPEYFRLLQHTGYSDDDELSAPPPSSPIRRLVQGDLFPRAPSETTPPADAEVVPPATSKNIKREAFSPNYFTRFFVEERELGRGGKGVVLLVRHVLDGVSLGHFACKRVPVGDDHAWLEKVLVEVQLLQTLSHPNLVSYRHVWLEDVQLSTFGPSVPCAFILQQYCNAGDLLHYIVGSPKVTTKEQLKERIRRRSRGQAERPQDLKASQRKLSFDEIHKLFQDIAAGLGHLHDSSYVHRDLKPSNCLLHRTTHNGSPEMRCLISDFGEVQAENIMRKSTGATGTISYCAPEVLKQDASGCYGNFTAKSDIFSLGMILYFLCFGRLPYQSAEDIQEEFEDLDQLRAEISAWSGFREERRARPDLPDQLYDFLKVMLAADPDERPTAAEILQAIQTGAGLKQPQRHGRNGSLNGGNLNVSKRIQTVDSPVPDAVRDDARRIVSAGSVYLEDDDEEPDFMNRGSLSPTRPRPRSKSPSPHTPLLLPAPSGPLANARARAHVYLHGLRVWTAHNAQGLTLSIKMLLFVAKLYSLTEPCMPSATSALLFYPLVCLASLDVALGIQQPRWRASGVLLVFHAVVVGVAIWREALCANRSLWSHTYPWHSGTVV